MTEFRGFPPETRDELRAALVRVRPALTLAIRYAPNGIADWGPGFHSAFDLPADQFDFVRRSGAALQARTDGRARWRLLPWKSRHDSHSRAGGILGPWGITSNSTGWRISRSTPFIH